MSIKDVIGSTVELIVKVVFLVFAATYIMRGATAAYEYGFRVFTEEPVSLGEGRTISVSVEEPVSARDVGEMLEERGLIRDANLFVIQELLSENHGKIQSGIYDLSTAMTAEEMLNVMSADAPEEEDAASGDGQRSTGSTDTGLEEGSDSDTPDEGGTDTEEETP